jgi:hypothetical protein
MSSPYPHVTQFEQLTLEQERAAQLRRELETARPPHKRTRPRFFGLRFRRREPAVSPC